MKLKDWREKKDWSRQQVADAVGTGRMQVYRWEMSGTIPSKKLMAQIESLTRKQVRAIDFYA